MFDAGTEPILAQLPDFEGLDAPSTRRLLTRAYAQVLAAKDFGDEVHQQEGTEVIQQMRRLATALEIHALMAPDLEIETLRSCAFVAAEALEVVSRLVGDPIEEYAGIAIQEANVLEAGALYLVAGFDANAAVCSRALSASRRVTTIDRSVAAETMLNSIERFLANGVAVDVDRPELSPDLDLEGRVRWEIMLRIAEACNSHLVWLRAGDADESPAGFELEALANQLRDAGRHEDLSHIATLLSMAAQASSSRSLRVAGDRLPGGQIWRSYIRERIKSQPLLWPAAHDYLDVALPGPNKSAVVTSPTGAGKSAVAELAIAQALESGRVVYLAPTNALVAQILRDLRETFASVNGVEVRAFMGGAEYSDFDADFFADETESEILVMTPEKCSLALRQSPDEFASVRLLIVDECHILGDPNQRGALAEMVVSETLYRAPNSRALFLSALVGNAPELSDWLEAATGYPCETVEEPWRPTRTLRSVFAMNRPTADAAYEVAVKSLQDNPRRKHWKFECDTQLLANVQGAWSGVNEDDYLLVDTPITVELKATRQDNGTIRPDLGGYVNRATGDLAHFLASTGNRVLAFLPANKHYSFSVARDLADVDPRPHQNAPLEAINAHIDLAEFELGVPSALRTLIGRGIAVHTSAMTRDEQRASELAFACEQTPLMFATGTLAQGLNLPATAVVIGGTRVGDDREVPPDVREERSRAQLLNAIGRAGRAYVATRALAVVIPDRAVAADREDVTTALSRAPFLEYEDASIEVRSQIESLIGTILDGDIEIGAMSSSEQTAFSYLSTEDAIDGAQIVRRSFGGYRRNLDNESAGNVDATLRHAGESFIELTEAPAWVSQVSHAAGISLPGASEVHRSLSEFVREEGWPESVMEWSQALVRVAEQISPPVLNAAMPGDYFKGTLVQENYGSGGERPSAFSALRRGLASWMAGEPLTEVGRHLIGPEVVGIETRTSGSPLPKIIAITERGFGFAIAGFAGAIAATVAIGRESEEGERWEPPPEAAAAVDLLPIAIRTGCDDVSKVAWHRWCARRRVAHALSREYPVPSELNQEQAFAWVAGQAETALEQLGNREIGELERLLAAVDIARRA